MPELREVSVHLFLVHGMSNHPFGKEADFQRKFDAKDYADILEKLRSREFRDEPKRHDNFIKSITECQFNPLVPRLAKRLKLLEKSDQSKLEWYLDGEGLLGSSSGESLRVNALQTHLRGDW